MEKRGKKKEYAHREAMQMIIEMETDTWRKREGIIGM